MISMDILKPRIDRLNLDTKKAYYQIKNVNGTLVKTYMGKFVRVYRMGSGDGMTLHLEFNDSGILNRVDEEMWGSLDGSKLSYFIEA